MVANQRATGVPIALKLVCLAFFFEKVIIIKCSDGLARRPSALFGVGGVGAAAC